MHSIREMRADELDAVVEYFHAADTEYLIGMGVDRARLPAKCPWADSLREQVAAGKRYYVAWLIDDEVVGHSNLSDVVAGDTANMHLHIWNARHRRAGHGLALLRRTLPLYFRRFALRTLVCEPYALNPAPHKVIVAAGFTFVKRYDAVPGPINFYQPVSRYEMGQDAL